MDETNSFLEELEVKEENILDKLDKPDEPVVEPEKVETSEEDGFQAKNRRERRLLEQNQRLREEAIAANARLQGINETKKFQESVGDDYIKEVRAIYGDDEPGKKIASDILENTLRKLEDTAVEKAYSRLQSERQQETEAVTKEEQALDEILDNVEDDHGIDMSNDDNRTGYLTLLEKLSPKDKNGDIIEYADPDTVAEVFKSRTTQSNSRAKELANRSRTESGASQPSKIEDDATVRYLKEIGVL